MKATLWMSGLVAAIALTASVASADEAPSTDGAAAPAEREVENPGAGGEISGKGAAAANAAVQAAEVAEQVAVAGDTQIEAQAEAEEEAAAEGEKKELFPIGATIIFDNSVGIGTFAPGEYTDRPLWSMALSMRPFVRLADNMRLTLRMDLSKDIIENADAATATKNETLLSDLILTYTVSPLVHEEVTGIKLMAWLDLLAPTSLASQTQTRILTLRPGLGLSKDFGWVSLNYQFRFDYNINQSKYPAFDVADAAEPPCLSAKLLDGGGAVCGSRSNTQFQFMNRFIVEFVPVERLAIAIDFIIYNAFGYEMPDDELTADNAKPGLGQRDLTAGTVEISYQVLDELALALGTTTLQPPKTLDNEGFRFPFFDYRSTSDNLTSVYFDVIATF